MELKCNARICHVRYWVLLVVSELVGSLEHVFCWGDFVVIRLSVLYAFQKVLIYDICYA